MAVVAIGDVHHKRLSSNSWEIKKGFSHLLGWGSIAAALEVSSGDVLSFARLPDSAEGVSPPPPHPLSTVPPPAYLTSYQACSTVGALAARDGWLPRSCALENGANPSTPLLFKCFCGQSRQPGNRDDSAQGVVPLRRITLFADAVIVHSQHA